MSAGGDSPTRMTNLKPAMRLRKIDWSSRSNYEVGKFCDPSVEFKVALQSTATITPATLVTTALIRTYP